MVASTSTWPDTTLTPTCALKMPSTLLSRASISPVGFAYWLRNCASPTSARSSSRSGTEAAIVAAWEASSANTVLVVGCARSRISGRAGRGKDTAEARLEAAVGVGGAIDHGGIGRNTRKRRVQPIFDRGGRRDHEQLASVVDQPVQPVRQPGESDPGAGQTGDRAAVQGVCGQRAAFDAGELADHAVIGLEPQVEATPERVEAGRDRDARLLSRPRRGQWGMPTSATGSA